jgi:hypothetical protein
MPIKRYVQQLDDEVRLVAAMDLNQMWDRVLGEMLDAFVRFDRQGLSDTEMESEMQGFLDGLSEKPTEDLARKSAGVSYNQGRSAEILTAADAGDVQFVVRSEILDSNTCATCETLDGFVLEVGTSDYDRWLPPAGCEGGDRCRGFYVALHEGVQA